MFPRASSRKIVAEGQATDFVAVMSSYGLSRLGANEVGAWRRTLVFIGIFLLASPAASGANAAEPEWKVGQANVKITPAKPLMLAGYAARNRPFDRIEDDLFAKALVIEDASGNRGVTVWQFGDDLTFVGLSGEVVVDFVPLIEKAIGPL